MTPRQTTVLCVLTGLFGCGVEKTVIENSAIPKTKSFVTAPATSFEDSTSDSPIPEQTPAMTESDTPSAQLAVVELFTSQGCSSCPLADRLLQLIHEKTRPPGENVLCLSFHVDYWNSLGWRDPYSSEQYSQRQHWYARQFQSGRIYTPQMVVNGTTEFVGSNGQAAAQAITAALTEGSQTGVELRATITADQHEVIVTYEVSGKHDDCVLNIALVTPGVGNDVPRGENAGRQLTHTNVVRAFRVVELTSPSGEVRLPIPAESEPEDHRIIAYVQRRSDSRITGGRECEMNE